MHSCRHTTMWLINNDVNRNVTLSYFIFGNHSLYAQKMRQDRHKSTTKLYFLLNRRFTQNYQLFTVISKHFSNTPRYINVIYLRAVTLWLIWYVYNYALYLRSIIKMFSGQAFTHKHILHYHMACALCIVQLVHSAFINKCHMLQCA